MIGLVSGEKMKTQERISLVKSHLNTIVEKGTDVSYMVTRDSHNDKIILFNCSSDKKVTIDIPYRIMRREERKRFAEYFGDKFRKATYAFTREATIEEATKYTERIFKRVFGLPDNFSIEVEIELD